jgi:hypothetical protein
LYSGKSSSIPRVNPTCRHLFIAFCFPSLFLDNARCLLIPCLVSELFMHPFLASPLWLDYNDSLRSSCSRSPRLRGPVFNSFSRVSHHLPQQGPLHPATPSHASLSASLAARSPVGTICHSLFSVPLCKLSFSYCESSKKCTTKLQNHAY